MHGIRATAGVPPEVEEPTCRLSAAVHLRDPAGGVHDPLLYYDVSSYGPRALEAMLRVVGGQQLVYGSDRPVVEAIVPPADTVLGHALLRVNPARLLAPAPAPVSVAA